MSHTDTTKIIPTRVGVSEAVRFVLPDRRLHIEVHHHDIETYGWGYVAEKLGAGRVDSTEYGQHGSRDSVLAALGRKYGVEVSTLVEQYMYASPATLKCWPRVAGDVERRAALYQHGSGTMRTAVTNYMLGVYTTDHRFVPTPDAAVADTWGSLLAEVAQQSAMEHNLRGGWSNREHAAWLASEAAKALVDGTPTELVSYIRPGHPIFDERHARDARENAAWGGNQWVPADLTTQLAAYATP